MKLKKVQTDLQGGELCLVDPARGGSSPLPTVKAVAELFMASRDGGERSNGERKCSSLSRPEDCRAEGSWLLASALSGIIAGIRPCSAIIALATGWEQGI
jgi:hypothetical protein